MSISTKAEAAAKITSVVGFSPAYAIKAGKAVGGASPSGETGGYLVVYAPTGTIDAAYYVPPTDTETCNACAILNQ